ncbi:hypothetical protein FNF27_05169 [Cafeteria roenbergensis]|uniref:Uncharacterized protein n=1 Tax=Cafeteria roenbergensis TaxID=33653 RepID=A0A5A8E6Q6_CAFRO|nr:hypothetical protein FNF27_05169 [Cafeteria roenbergensis]
MCPSGKARERGCDGAESWPGRDGSVAITSTPAAGEGLGAAPARVTTPTVTSPASGPEVPLALGAPSAVVEVHPPFASTSEGNVPSWYASSQPSTRPTPSCSQAVLNRSASGASIAVLLVGRLAKPKRLRFGRQLFPEQQVVEVVDGLCDALSEAK